MMKMPSFLHYSLPPPRSFFYFCLLLLLPLLLLLLLFVAPSSSSSSQDNNNNKHGNDECFLNTIEACAVTVYPNVAQHFRFIHCIENLTLEGRQNQWVNCFQMTGLPKLPLDCYTNGNGKNIEQKFAQETTQLNPPHRFVPWVVVNNQALQEDYPNFVNYICKAYKGKSKPDGCRSLSTRTYDMMKDGNNSFQKPVCYVGHVKNLTLP
ncbi:gamma-interferon-responsive lysosomal thiol protein isoform X3 [Arachis duranensis]|uniref:Gamma-interferon-responsive lysosomal thiol protein isoform X3 n=1 Tax=Arachis duranensis TaxID=130453 RepID=A0A9C6TQS7_ARADU|nr:gamma-interferon-responsive lysosomal thiol protein isoform X3 [Arachis duranensis]